MKAKHDILGVVEVNDSEYEHADPSFVLPITLKNGARDSAHKRSLTPIPEAPIVSSGVSLNELGRQVHESAREKGWYEPGKEKTFLESMMLVVAEISEAAEEYRSGFDYDEVYYKFEPIEGLDQAEITTDGVRVFAYQAGDEPYPHSVEEMTPENAEQYGYKAKPEGIPIEIADAVIRILDECANRGIDIDEAIRIKMEFNRTRPYRHGNKLA